MVLALKTSAFTSTTANTLAIKRLSVVPMVRWVIHAYGKKIARMSSSVMMGLAPNISAKVVMNVNSTVIIVAVAPMAKLMMHVRKEVIAKMIFTA
jgi:hypothetical protein